MERELRSKLIRLAHENPHLRSDILPLLGEPKTAAADKKVKGKALDKLISDTYYKHGNYVVINMMSIPKIYKEATDAYTAAATHAEGLKALDDAMKAAIAKYRTASQSKLAHGPVALRDPDVMLYFIDRAANSSKFYEMKVIKSGTGFLLQKRWGRLTDSGATGRVDSKDEAFAYLPDAQRAMAMHKLEKTRKGYKEANGQYPIGLGSAGFGWGGQVACNYVPELRAAFLAVGKAKTEVSSLVEPLNKLTAKQSGMAADLSRLLGAVSNPLDALSKYLENQLKDCR